MAAANDALASARLAIDLVDAKVAYDKKYPGIDDLVAGEGTSREYTSKAWSELERFKLQNERTSELPALVQQQLHRSRSLALILVTFSGLFSVIVMFFNIFVASIVMLDFFVVLDESSTIRRERLAQKP